MLYSIFPKLSQAFCGFSCPHVWAPFCCGSCGRSWAECNPQLPQQLCKGILLFLLILLYWAIHFSLMPSLPLPSHSNLSHGPHALNIFTRSCFFYFPCRLDPCMSHLGSFLLSRSSRFVNRRLVLLCFMSKNHLWVSTCDNCLSGSGLPHSIWCFLHPSICPQISRCRYFFHCVVLHCVNVPFSLSIHLSRGI